MNERFDDEIVAVLREAELRSPTKSDCWLLVADWACQTVVPMALAAAERWDEAEALREAPALTADTDHAWAQRLRDLAETLARDPTHRHLSLAQVASGRSVVTTSW